MIIRLFFALLFLPVAGFAADALPVEFNGVFVAGGKTKVSLYNFNTGTARWVKIGGKFESYTVTNYIPDPKAGDVVILTKTGSTQTVRLLLKNSYLKESPPPLVKVTDDQIIKTNDNLHRIADAANEYFREHGGTTVKFEQLPEEITKSIVPVVGEKYTDMVIKWNNGEVQIDFWLPGGANFQIGNNR